MSTSQNTTLLNDSYTLYTRLNNAKFELFPLLPTDLRLYIWELSICRSRRILGLILTHPVFWAATEKNDSGYGLEAPKWTRPNSKLLRVNRESRDVALRFYRVHLPTRRIFTRNDITTCHSPILHFNPESDVLLLSHIKKGEVFANLIHDLVAYDPRGVGILHLGFSYGALKRVWEATVTGGDTSGEDEAEEPWPQHPLAAQGVARVIPRLQTLTWEYSIRVLCGALLPAEPLCDGVPIVPYTTCFELPMPDPRPLTQVAKAMMSIPPDEPNPGNCSRIWRQILSEWELELSPDCRVSILLGQEATLMRPGGSPGQVLDSPDVRSYLRDVRMMRDANFYFGKIERYHKARYHEEGLTARMVNPEVPSVIGYWMLDAEAVEEVPWTFKRYLRGDAVDVQRFPSRLLLATLE
ncbi:hypothetical protein QBC34DRAFT_464329 [Podospora aff. communis PSN243]|uniref:2EXR domain-containing protein n=1 Tax=Podospora aff. communis PSN243 TaxID=3040156 RepID=A0AAV9GMV3_9PEZI|nr:hypothetical protein QBC34DRAFT_464329 [Podospora aff. communis PSN243]